MNITTNLLSFISSLKVYCKPKVVAIFFLGFASGLPLALTTSTLTIWLTEVGINIKSIGTFALVGIPYALKFLWAPLLDFINIPYLSKKLGKRSSWLIVSQIVLAISIIALGNSDPTENIFMTGLLAVCVAFCSATQDIVIDAYRIALIEKNEQGAGAAMVTFGYRIAILFTGAGALYLSEYYDWSVVYSIGAAALIVGVITVLVLGEPNNTSDKTSSKMHGLEYFLKVIIKPFLDFTNHKGWIYILLFTMFFKLGDALAGVMTNPFLMYIGFSKSEIATIVKVIGLGATLTGSFIAGTMVYKIGMLKSLWIGGILQMLSNLMFVALANIGYDTQFLAITICIENFAGGLGSTVFVAYLSSLCNVKYTATQYSLLSAIALIGRTIISSSSGKLVEVLGWIPFFMITVLAAIPGLIFLYKLTKNERKTR